MMEFTLLHTSVDGSPCPECKAISFSINAANLLNYFLGKEVRCPKCNTKLDWWKLLLRHFEWGVPSYLYAIVGGFNTTLMIKVKLNEIFTLDLQKAGIPNEGKILQINYTPNGKGLFPLEIHGNSPYRHFIPHKIFLFGRPLGNPTDETPVAVSVNWVLVNANDVLWNNFVEAVEAFSINKFPATIIPANVAVEAKLNDLLDQYLNSYASARKVSDFLTEGATYSHQLNVLLPLIAHYENFPALFEHIRDGLNELRKYRNHLAHRGTIMATLDKKIAGRLLCSASFALGYLDLLGQKIKENAENKLEK